MEFLKLFLLPLAFIYGLIIRVRNKLFDWKLISSEFFTVPVISVGNLTVGGTGKTPHVEYITRLLSKEYKVATLSRGYGRETSGFKIACDEDQARTIGDEPMQFYNKFPGISVAVDSNRRRGIKNILKLKPETDVVILDDAFQHRFVKPGLSILLSDYHKLFFHDYLLPVGTLREHRKGSRRADLIIITKTPEVLSPFERRRIIEGIKPLNNQKVLFSYIRYRELKSLWKPDEPFSLSNHYGMILLVAGIANAYPLEFRLRDHCNELITMRFDDHHKYTRTDLERIKQNYSDLYTRNKLLVTTEKDAMRMLEPSLRDLAAQLPIYYIPIQIDFHGNDKHTFDQTIKDYVKENKREH